MSEPQGPTMICATAVVKPGRARIGHIGGNITLPRTVEILTLVAVLIGALLGLAVGAFVPTGGVQRFVFGAMFGGAGGWFIVTFSPMQNESLLTWFGLTVNTLRKQRYVEGRPVVLAVGVSVVDRQSAGRIRLVRGAVRVPSGTYDDRGVARTERNRNLPDGAVAVAGGFVTGVRISADAGGRHLPDDSDAPADDGRRRPAPPRRSGGQGSPGDQRQPAGWAAEVAAAQHRVPPASGSPDAVTTHPGTPTALAAVDASTSGTRSVHPSPGSLTPPSTSAPLGPRLLIPTRDASRTTISKPRKLKD